IAVAHIRGTTPYSQSRPMQTEKLPKESPRDYEERAWRDRIHADADGQVYIPPTAWKNGIAEAAKYLSIQVPGKGKATYTKHFEAGSMVAEPGYVGVHRDAVPGEWIFVPSDGKRGGGSRVWKCFPVISRWSVKVKFFVLDETITEDVFEQHLREMGQFIGLGR